MKRDFNLWLEDASGRRAPVKTLTELREWNIAHAKAGAIKFGQSRLDISDEMDLETDRARYEADHKKDHRCSAATNGIDGVLKANRLDAILTPGGAGAGLAARAGYPIIVVPFATGAERADAAVPGGLRREAGAVRRRLHRHGVQRAAADRAGLRVRAGDEKARPAGIDAVAARPFARHKNTSFAIFPILAFQYGDVPRFGRPIRSARPQTRCSGRRVCLAGVLVVLKAGYLGVHGAFAARASLAICDRWPPSPMRISCSSRRSGFADGRCWRSPEIIRGLRVRS